LKKQTPDELGLAIGAARSYMYAAAAFSLAINLLYLASPLYMLQVYNRVVTSGSQVTLLLLTAILLVAFAALAALDTIRARVLSRMGLRVDRLLSARIMTASFSQTGGSGARSQPLRDFDTFRQFISSGSINPLLDLPWVPLYIGFAFLLHPIIGAFALVSAVLLLGLAIANEIVLNKPLREANEAASRSHGFAEMSLRNAEVVVAMGMTDGVIRRWARDRKQFLDRQAIASDIASGIGGLIRFLRLSMQSLVLGLGALLAVERLVSPGAMFASTFLLGRALQPIEQIVGSWRNIVAARAAYLRIRELLEANPLGEPPLLLPRPAGAISAENLHFALRGTSRLALRGVTFRLAAGESLGVIGPSGAGKSTLMRLLVGVLQPSAGAVRIDGADLQTWSKSVLGRHLGYLPQDIELFADTVAANISRFSNHPEVDDDVVRAAKLAGVHEMILRLPQGYNTQVGEGGAVLSGGYRQRIGLARAVFGAPSVVVLDEPGSNLDGEGDSALANCIAELRRLKTTVIIVSHRPATISGVDKVLCLKEGTVEEFGPREQVTARFIPRSVGAPREVVKIVS
jgi:ATP-binding cassette, subfamily C, bacterial